MSLDDRLHPLRDAQAIRTARDDRISAAFLGLGALAYTAWVLEVVSSTGLDPIRTYVSELAAEHRPWARVGWAALLLFGVAIAIELAVTVWTLSSVAAFQAGRGTWLLGLGRRAQVLLVAVWLALFALALARASRHPGRAR